MYLYSKAVALKKTIGAQWQAVDLSEKTVAEIYNEYSRVVLELTNTFLEEPMYVDMETLRDDYLRFGGTIPQMLLDINDLTLETVPSFPTATVKYCRYTDAYQAGYKIELCEAGKFYPNNYPKPDLSDIALSRPKYKTDMSSVHDYCLITVNGYLHLTDTDGNYCYVYGAGDSLHKCGKNYVGVLSFQDIGKVKKVPITDSMIISREVNTPMAERTYLKLDEDLSNKYVLLSLGGYLMFPDGQGLTQVGDQLFGINFGAFSFVERVLESMQYLDLTPLGLQSDETLPDTISVEQLMTDEVLIRYLKLSQSFFVVVDANNLFANAIHLRNSNHPGMFTAYQEPTAPLVVGRGKLAEYWKKEEDGFWSVTVEDSFYRNYVFEGNAVKHLKNVNNALLAPNPFNHSRAHLLEIGAYVL